MEQSERIRQMIEANAAAMEEVTRSHKEIQDGVAGVDRTIRTILEVSRDLREMTGHLAKTFSWFEEVLQIGEREGSEKAAVVPSTAPARVDIPAVPAGAAEITGAETAEAGAAGSEIVYEEIPELEGGNEEEDEEEAVELVEALDDEPPAADDLFLAEDLDEVGVTLEAAEPAQAADGEAEALQVLREDEDAQDQTYRLEDVEELEAVEEEVEEL
jgi:hypothetical protein